MTPRQPPRKAATRRQPWLRRPLAGVVALLLCLPGAAYPISLSQLLRLPLEELLRLQVSAPAAAPRLRTGGTAAPTPPAERSRA